MKPISKRLKKAKDLVFLALKEFPESRSNDMELIRKVWELQGFRIPKRLLGFYYKVMNPETITRCRREIQGEGFYLGDGLKTAQRTLSSMEFRNHYKKNSSGLTKV